MTAPRAAFLVIMLLIPAVLWGWAMSVRDDAAKLTVSVIRQVQTVGPRDLRVGHEDAAVEAAFSRFFRRYRYPDGNLEDQLRHFESLWPALLRCSPASVKQSGEDRFEVQAGRTLPRRIVMVAGTDPAGEAMEVELRWVQYRGSWYIHSYELHSAG
jgi:hypothetical protein